MLGGIAKERCNPSGSTRLVAGIHSASDPTAGST